LSKKKKKKKKKTERRRKKTKENTGAAAINIAIYEAVRSVDTMPCIAPAYTNRD